MKKLRIISIAVLVLSLSSCQALDTILHAGVGLVVFAVIAAIALLVFIAAKFIGRGK